LVYVKQLNYPAGQARHLVISTDFDNGLYVVWYQPSVITAKSPSVPASAGVTNMTYVRMSVTGVIDSIGSGEFRDPIIGVTVLNDGAVYGVSPDGLVSVVTPSQEQTNSFALSAIALVSCVSVAGFAGSVLLEEGRYRWAAVYGRIASKAVNAPDETDQRLLRLRARRPGLQIKDIKRLTEDSPVGMVSLLGMEKYGMLASFRDGFSRRFYVKGSELGQTDSLRTRILLWVADHPGIWEAQLAKDLALSQQAVHYHLKKLREAKLISATLDTNNNRKLYRFANAGHEGRDPKVGS